MKEPRAKPAPRVGRKDQQDPDRGNLSPREGGVDRGPERSDREAGAGRPVQLDAEGRTPRPESDSPRPTDDAPPAK